MLHILHFAKQNSTANFLRASDDDDVKKTNYVQTRVVVLPCVLNECMKDNYRVEKAPSTDCYAWVRYSRFFNDVYTRVGQSATDAENYIR